MRNERAKRAKKWFSKVKLFGYSQVSNYWLCLVQMYWNWILKGAKLSLPRFDPLTTNFASWWYAFFWRWAQQPPASLSRDQFCAQFFSNGCHGGIKDNRFGFLNHPVTVATLLRLQDWKLRGFLLPGGLWLTLTSRHSFSFYAFDFEEWLLLEFMHLKRGSKKVPKTRFAP